MALGSIYRRMQKLSRTVGKVPVQHFYQRGYGERKDDVSKCAVAGDSAGGTNRDDRGQRRAAVKICAKSGFSRNQKRQHGGMQNDFRAGSDPQQFKNAADRIIVGEVRGAEICELLTAYNSGHAGSMSTGHGNTARDMLLRMETMLRDGNGHSIVCHTKTDRIGN